MRSLRLVLTTIVCLGALSGCAFSNPLIEGTPTPHSLDSDIKAQVDAAVSLNSQAHSAVQALIAMDPSPSLPIIAATLSEQSKVLWGPNPLARLPWTSAIPADPPSSAEPSYDAVDQAFIAMRESFTANAVASPGPWAGFWASLAASAEQMRVGVGGVYTDPVPADTTRTIEATSEEEALSEIISRYHEQVFLLESAVGYLPDNDPERTTVLSMLSDLRARRDALITHAEALGIEPPASRGVYGLPEGRDRQACLGIVSTAQTVLGQAAGVWVVSAASPEKATQELIFTATLGSSLGLGATLWPGWPDV